MFLCVTGQLAQLSSCLVVTHDCIRVNKSYISANDGLSVICWVGHVIVMSCSDAMFSRSLIQSFIHSFCQSVSQSVGQSVSQSLTHSLSQSVWLSVSQLVTQCFFLFCFSFIPSFSFFLFVLSVLSSFLLSRSFFSFNKDIIIWLFCIRFHFFDGAFRCILLNNNDEETPSIIRPC